MTDQLPPPPPNTIEQRLAAIEHALDIIETAVVTHETNFRTIAPVIQVVARMLAGLAGMTPEQIVADAQKAEEPKTGGYL